MHTADYRVYMIISFGTELFDSCTYHAEPMTSGETDGTLNNLINIFIGKVQFF